MSFFRGVWQSLTKTLWRFKEQITLLRAAASEYENLRGMINPPSKLYGEGLTALSPKAMQDLQSLIPRVKEVSEKILQLNKQREDLKAKGQSTIEVEQQISTQQQELNTLRIYLRKALGVRANPTDSDAKLIEMVQKDYQTIMEKRAKLEDLHTRLRKLLEDEKK